MIFPPFTNLITERLYLRELDKEDAPEIFRMRSDARVNEFIDRAPTISLDESQKFIQNILTAQHKQEGMMWAITLKDNPKLIGTIVYWHIAKENDKAEIGYEMLPEYQGKGIMQETLTEVIRFGFEIMQLKTIVAETKANHLKSINVLKKCGFEEIEKIDDGYLVYRLNK